MKIKSIWNGAKTIVFTTVLLSFTACSPDKPASSTGEKENKPAAPAVEKIKIGLITKTNANPFFVKIREKATEVAEKNGATLIALAGSFDGDNEGQVSGIENLVRQGVKGILITPSSSTGILAAIKKARDAGVIVIALDTTTDPADAVDATYATDNKVAGELQGKWVKATLGNKKLKLLMLDGSPGGTSGALRHDGFLSAFGLKDDSPEILGRANTYGDQTKAQAAMENLLRRAKNANALYTINEPAAAGGYAAIKAAGLSGKIIIGSVDGGCVGVANVKNKTIGATVMQFPAKMAEQGVEAIVNYAKTKIKPSGFINTGSELITDSPVNGLDSKDTAWGEKNCWG